MRIKRTQYAGKTLNELLLNITTEKVKLNQTETEFIKQLTKDVQQIIYVNGDQKLNVELPQWKIRKEVDALNDFDLKARKTIRVAGYEKERKNSTEYMPKALGTEIKKQNKKIDQRTAKILAVTFRQINEMNKLNGEKVLQARHIDFEKIAKIVTSENAQARAYASKATTVKIPKNMNKEKKMKLKKEALEKAKSVIAGIKFGKNVRYKERQKVGRQNLIKMLEKGGFSQYYINMVKRFTNTQITMVFSSYEFFKYGTELFYDEDAMIRFQATEMLEFIKGERKNLSDKSNVNDVARGKQEDTLIDSKEAIKNEYISTTNTMRKQRKKAKK